ncbi:HD domain-containing protein [Ditylenchus destructor]|nr:HD domain-containing protein [Ditylenchus destructor]
MSSNINIVELLRVLDNLKHLKRTGWVHFNVPEPETVASHMYRMAVLSMGLEGIVDKDVDINKCVRMSLVHDIGEAIVGDITPRCGISDEKKFELEEQAVQKIASYIPPIAGDDWIKLWMEYENASTKEALIVKQLDKIDMLAQALSYEEKYGIDLGEFFNSTVGIFKTEPFKTWDADIRAKRQKKTN